MGIYLKYITNYLIRKTSFWVVFIVYLFIFSLICLIIPATINAYFVWAWVTDFRTLTIVLEYLIALFAAMIAVIIFQMPREDGSELLICSKPIHHYKMITAKFIIFIITCLCYALVSASLACFGFFLQTNYWTVLSLVISMFTISCIFSFLYGGIAILTSVKYGKLWIISLNMILVFITNIIFLVGATGLKEPATAITDSKSTISSSVTFVNRDNQQVNGDYIISLSGDDFNLPDLEWEKQVYQEGVDNSTTKWIYPFDITGHMYIMSNLGYLDNVRKEINGNCEIGQSSAYTYKINDLVHKYPTESLPDNYDDDNYELWTEFASPDAPLFYTQYQDIKKADLKELVQINTTLPSDIDAVMQRLMELLQDVITNENIVCPSGISSSNLALNIANPISFDAPYSNTRFLFDYDDPWSKSPTYTVGKFFNGTSRTRNIIFKNPESLEPSDVEKDIFDYLIYELMFDKGSSLYNCLVQDGTYWKWNLKTDPNAPFKLIYKEIYNVLSNNNVKAALNLNSDYDYGYELYKFKYYLSRQLLGYYGIENVKCSNWMDNPTEKITVPYFYYFRLVFIPQYNSYTIRNLDQYRTELPMQVDGMDVSPKEFLQYGTFVLPPLQKEFGYGKFNFISYAFTDDNIFQGGYPLVPSTCLYDGNLDTLGLKHPELYEIYDLTNDGWVTMSNQFGYFSELGLKIDTLLNEFAFSRLQIYGNKGYTNLYGSYVDKNSIQLTLYQHLLFSYTCDPVYSPYMLIAIYLIVDFIILSLGYVAYIRHDVK